MRLTLRQCTTAQISISISHPRSDICLGIANLDFQAAVMCCNANSSKNFLHHSAFLASKPWRKAHPVVHLPFVLQYGSYLHRNTPPTCIFVESQLGGPVDGRGNGKSSFFQDFSHFQVTICKDTITHENLKILFHFRFCFRNSTDRKSKILGFFIRL